MSSKHLDRLTQDIFSELPSDREVMILFRAYKEITHPFWGFVIDIDDLESRIMIYLEERAKNAREHSKSSRRVSASWLAILFSVMAVGSQYRDSPYHIRTRDAQRYVQISFHFLRLGNFLLRWTCLWHDTLTSLSFDRPNMTNIQCCPIPLSPSSSVEGLSYLEAMYTLCEVISQKLNPDATAGYSYETILENCQAVESIRDKVFPQLRSKEACKSVVDKLQHYAIRLHTSFVISVRQLQGDLISALSAAAAKEQTSPAPDHIPKIDRDIELSGPLSRALTALKNIYDYGSLHGASGVKSESASGTRTPIGASIPQSIQNINNQFRLQPGFDRHQDAALAMAELQNGNNIADFSTTMPYQPTIQQTIGIPDLNQLDPTTLAPMDLYDSIFWESPDPFYAGADMNFDFLPQAPPGQSQQQFYF
ncbi:hypothetical protein ABKA04_000201 [Annulohypoxylon sp. FPYF3050]